MFKINWAATWNHLSIKVDRRTGDTFLYRDGPSEFKGYPVPVFYVEQLTLGMDGI